MSDQYWLMKTEPDVYSINQLKTDGITHWEGIRNYQARNFMMNTMCIGDWVFVYHSNCSPPGIVGLAQVASTAYPDFFSWDEQSPYHDPKSTPKSPRWFMVDIGYICSFNEIISLEMLKKNGRLSDMLVVKKGQRLSIQPVQKEDFHYIIETYV